MKRQDNRTQGRGGRQGYAARPQKPSELPKELKGDKLINRMTNTYKAANPKPIPSHVPLAKKHKIDTTISGEAALSRLSSLPPTRLALDVNFNSLMAFIRSIAIMMSYRMQQKSGTPNFIKEIPETDWNPSALLAYLVYLTGNYFLKVGYLSQSTVITVPGSLNVPTFFAMWLQQLAPSSHYGRDITLSLDKGLQDFMNYDCGTGGLEFLGAMVPAPCKIAQINVPPNDTEDWFSINGQNGYPVITPASLTANQLAQLSAAICRAFDNRVQFNKIATKASNNELKCTPLAQTIAGLFMYSVIDCTSQNDLTLALVPFLEPTLLNSPLALQTAAPVRIDGALASCQEAKVALLFNISCNHKYKKKESFLKYLTDFGFKQKHWGNIQLNIRQVNWLSVQNLVGQWINTLVKLGVESYPFLLNYVTSAITAKIPGEFRSFFPIKQQWGLAPLNAQNALNSNYVNSQDSCTLPPFVATWMESLSKPIRSGNQVYFFMSAQQALNDNPYWQTLATAGTTHLGSNQFYGSGPIPPTQTNLQWPAGPGYLMYPEFEYDSQSPAGYADARRNNYVIHGSGSLAAYFQQQLITPGTNTSIYTTWLSKYTKITSRQARFYIPCTLGPIKRFPIQLPDTETFSISVPIPQQIVSWEPATHHPVVLALIFLFTYYCPSSTKIATIAPLYSAIPKPDLAENIPIAMSAGNPAGGTPQSIMLGSSKNPAEVSGHLMADSVGGILADQSDDVPTHLTKNVENKMKDMTETVVHDVADGAKEAVSKGFKAAVSLI